MDDIEQNEEEDGQEDQNQNSFQQENLIEEEKEDQVQNIYQQNLPQMISLSNLDENALHMHEL